MPGCEILTSLHKVKHLRWACPACYSNCVMAKRFFTLQEARDMLPWLSQQFDKLDLAREVENRLQQDAIDVFRKSRSNGKSSMEREIAASQKAVEEAMTETSALTKEIAERGIIVRHISTGLVDFLSMRDGREIFLCWVRGEDDIGFWHGVHEGYASRKPL